MSIYQQNIHAFLSRYPEEVNNVKLFETKKDLLLTRNKLNNFQLWEDEKIIADTTPGAYYPVNVPSFTPKISIMLGLGLGKRLIDVIDTTTKEKKNLQVLVIIEPSYERFLKACQITNFTKLFQQQNVIWFIGKSVANVYDSLYKTFFDLFMSRNRYNLWYFEHPLVYKKDQEYFDNIQKEIKQAADLMYSSFGSQEDCFLGISNTIKNLENVNNTPGYFNLQNKFTGLPAVVVSTGPSLEKSIPKLKKHRDKYVLFAADASLKILLNHGIIPDIVATLERDDTTMTFFNELDLKDKQPYMVYFPLSPKITVDAYKGPKYVVYRNYNYYDYFQNESPKGTIMCGHSVAHMCTKLANIAGCSKIVLVGQDLAYPVDNIATHAEGASHGEKFKSKEDLAAFFRKRNFGRLHEVKGLNGEDLYTHDIFLYFAREFIMEQTDSKGRVYNATERGLNIPEVPKVEFEEIAATFPDKVEVDDILKDNHKLEEQRVSIDKLLEKLNKVKRELEKDLRKLNEVKSQKTKKIRSFIRKLDERRVEYYYKDKVICGFVIESDSKLLLGIENEYNILDINKDDHLAKMVELSERWFQEAARITKEVIENIENSRQD